MKKTLMIVALVLSLPFLGMAQTTAKKNAKKHMAEEKAEAQNHDEVREQLIKMEKERAAAAVKADTGYLDQHSSADYTLVSAQGQLSTKEQMLDNFKSGKMKLTSNEPSDLNVRIYGNAAVVTGIATVKGTLNGKDISGRNRFTRVYVKQGGKWLSVAFQQTRIQ